MLDDALELPYDRFHLQNNASDGTSYGIEAISPAGVQQIVEHGNLAPLGGRVIPHIGTGWDGLRPGTVYRVAWLHDAGPGIGQPYALSFILGAVGDVQDACFGG